MWNLWSKKKEITYPGFTWLTRDIHSHLLPGIDDGSPDVNTSIELLKHLSSAGISEFICTPHVIQDMFRNTPDTINNALSTLQAAVKKEGLDVHLSAAAEYMMDEFFLELLRSGEKLLTLKNDFILTEFPYSIRPNNIKEIAFEITTANYSPLLAHPERYAYFHRDKSIYHHLKDLGFSLQLNLLSLTGYYGARVREVARFLVKEDLIDYVGTDLHHSTHLEALLDKKSVRIFEENFGDKIYNEF